MNSSMCRADATTHLKIVATALLASTVFVWIGIATHASPGRAATLAPVKLGPATSAAIIHTRT